VLSAHCIDELQFVVDFATADQAFDTQERVAAFARVQAPRIIEEVFDRFSRPDRVWRLDALDIDLGPIAHDEVEQQWAARLRERLAEALQDEEALATGQAVREQALETQPADELGHEPQSGLHRRDQAQLDTLLHFLRFGHLPWHAPRGLALASPLGQLAHEVLRDNAQALVRAWRASPAARTMLQRAARQFPPTWLARLAAELGASLGAGPAAGWARQAQAWVDGFEALWSESTLASTPQRQLLWEGLLTALWSEAGENDRSQPLRSMVLALAPDETRQVEIWRALQSVARRALDGTPPAPTATLDEAVLHTCLAARVPAPARVDVASDEPGANAGSRSDLQARLLQRLQAWLPPHARDDDPSPWTELLRAEASWARQTLLQLTRSAAARARMAQALPPSLLLSLTALWLGPTEQGLLLAATEDTALWGPASAPVDVAQRWDFALSSVLLHPAPALFSGHEFLDSLLKRRSERENKPLPLLVRELEQVWRDNGRADATPTMRAWLRARGAIATQALEPLLQRRVRLEAALSEGLLAGMEDDWTAALDSDTVWLQAQVRRAARRPELLRRMAREWRGEARRQLVGLWLVAPERSLVFAAWQDPALAALAPAGERMPEQFLWEDLVAHLARLTPGSFFHADAYVRGLRERLVQADAKAAAPKPPPPSAAAAAVPQEVAATPRPSPPAQPVAVREPTAAIEQLVKAAPIHVANAGMVLVGAYLPQLFGMLRLTRDEGFVSPEAAERAVHLLHHLATGATEAPEPQLTLNKLLCGLDLAAPMQREFEIASNEVELIDGLLKSVISHWKIIGSTSVPGLREAFLQRDGRLTFDEEDGWHLQVEERSFDMLLDQLPWGYGMQKFSWMERPLHVAWR
jgi:hypothetical protein